MSERAGLFARAAVTRDVLHVYNDGLIAVLGGDGGRLDKARDLIHRDFSDAEEARVGGVGVFVVPTDLTHAEVEHLPPILALLTTSYHDHREQDADTIDAGVALVSVAIRGA